MTGHGGPRHTRNCGCTANSSSADTRVAVQNTLQTTLRVCREGDKCARRDAAWQPAAHPGPELVTRAPRRPARARPAGEPGPGPRGLNSTTCKLQYCNGSDPEHLAHAHASRLCVAAVNGRHITFATRATSHRIPPWFAEAASGQKGSEGHHLRIWNQIRSILCGALLHAKLWRLGIGGNRLLGCRR